jgi:DNA-directed RNA polymerase specialized sigma24 family protein
VEDPKSDTELHTLAERVAAVDPQALERLFSLASQGDQQAFRQLFAVLYKQLEPVIRAARITLTPTHSLIHDVFIKAAEHFSKTGFTLRDTPELKSWVHVVANRIELDKVRAAARLQSLPAHVEPHTPARQEGTAMLHKLVDQYPDKRAVRHFWLKEIEGYKYQEIEARGGFSESTIKSDVRQVRAYLNEIDTR